MWFLYICDFSCSYVFSKFRINFSTKVIGESWFVCESFHPQISSTILYIHMVSEWDPLCYGWHNGNNLKSLSGRNDRWQFRLYKQQLSCSRGWLVFIGNISMFITRHIPNITSMLLTHHHESELEALFHWFPMYLIWQIRKSHIPRSLWVC